MTTINFQTNGTFVGSVYDVDGVTITGSDVVADGPFTLGIGIDPRFEIFQYSSVDQGETIVFAFDSGAATDVSYNLGGYSYNVLARIEAFGVNGNSLGTVEQGGTFDSINVSQLFGGVAISKFQLTGSVGEFYIQQVSFIPATLNNPPVAGADSVSTAKNTPTNIAVACLLANDTDSNGDPLRITNVSNATGGTAVLNDNGTPTNYADEDRKSAVSGESVDIGGFSNIINNGQANS